MVYFEFFCLFFFFRKLVGQYKELLGALSVRWLKRIMVVSTSTYNIDTPCKLTVKGLMGRVSSFGPDPGPAGHFGCWGGCPLLLWEWPASWFSPLTVLPSSSRAGQALDAVCPFVEMLYGQRLGPCLRSWRVTRGDKLFQFPMAMIPSISSYSRVNA